MVEKINNFFNNSSSSDKIALFSLLISIILPIIIQFWSNRREDKKEKQQEQFQRETQDKLDKFQIFQKEFSQYKLQIRELQFNVERQSELKPYFHVNHHYSKVYLDNNDVIIDLFLTNVGRASATNIQIVLLNELKNGTPVYFDSGCNTQGNVTHSVYNYFSDYFALPTKSVSISIIENKTVNDMLNQIRDMQLHAYNLKFRISFSDIMENKYEQEFYIIYDYIAGQNEQSIAKNSMSYPPKLINN
ncbi:hypothetical protein [Streptococcus constellatus]|uniref:hypothetical protein n=1 Tax=Streptococcus constellatus TaxID=76860 RepID=UPI00123A1E15|nr:hypothetical protein [Streptococcus constellatus]